MDVQKMKRARQLLEDNLGKHTWEELDQISHNYGEEGRLEFLLHVALEYGLLRPEDVESIKLMLATSRNNNQAV